MGNLSSKSSLKSSLKSTIKKVPSLGSLPPSPVGSVKSLSQEQEKNKRYKHYHRSMISSDEIEQDRLTHMHFLYKHLFHSNFSAPIKDLLTSITSPRVLDIACGNGTWVLEMATEFPNTTFYGVDVVGNYPTTVKPSNTCFSKLDILDGLPFQDHYFDYIHMRQSYIYFSESDWQEIMKEINRLLKPGGFIEIRDVDPCIKHTGPSSTKFFEKFPEEMKQEYNVNVHWAKYMYDSLSKLNELAEIHQKIQILQFNDKDITGSMAQTSLRLALESFRFVFQKLNNIPSLQDYNQMVNQIIQECVQYGSFLNYYCCWGRKSVLIGQVTDIRRYSLLNLSTQHLSFPSSRNRSFNLEYSSSTSYDEDERNSVFSLTADNVSDIDQFIEGYED